MTFFSGTAVANSFKHVLEGMEEFKGTHVAFVSDWLAKKGLQKLFSKEFWLCNSSIL